MSAGREAVLGRLRHAYARDEAAEAAAHDLVRERIERHAPNLIPARGQRDLDGRADLFEQMARAVLADLRRLPALSDVPAATAAYLREHNLPQKMVMAPEPLLEGLPWSTQPLLRIRRGTAVDADQVGLTIAVAGVAETGTLVLASGPERPTLVAYMPETSIVVLPKERIDGAYEQAWERIRALEGGVPRSVNFITGPSRTADIAQKLELGAHGPKRLLILLVEQA